MAGAAVAGGTVKLAAIVPGWHPGRHEDANSPADRVPSHLLHAYGQPYARATRRLRQIPLAGATFDAPTGA